MDQTKWQWLALQFTKRLWFRASLFAVLGVATAFAAIVLERYLPDELPTQVGADAVDRLLGIIASSMLTVTTFSLTTMVSAYASSASGVTPRATRLLMEDRTSQNVLATFIGSFLFSLVGIIILSTGAYGERGRLVLFGVTLVVIVLIVVTLLRWIDHLSRLGRVTETIDRVEEEVIEVLSERCRRPFLGARPATEWREVEGEEVFAKKVGYVQHLDMAHLQELGERLDARIRVDAPPGTFLDLSRPLATISGPVSDEDRDVIRQAFTIERKRDFAQDPRFGLAVLAEVGSRALSASINDLGTAIDVVGRSVRVLSVCAGPREQAKPTHDRIFVPPLGMRDLFDDVFTPLARDGANLLEVQVRLQKALLALARLDQGLAPDAARHSAIALARAELALQLPDDVEAVRALARGVQEEARKTAGKNNVCTAI
ncbi:MAG: DUF2254 domain-containing protein [Mesorhizobium amorphae]|nr:MAG: DUF2254 domain-containing protein [Mesorhizobium amorphae]